MLRRCRWGSQAPRRTPPSALARSTAATKSPHDPPPSNASPASPRCPCSGRIRAASCQSSRASPAWSPRPPWLHSRPRAAPTGRLTCLRVRGWRRRRGCPRVTASLEAERCSLLQAGCRLVWIRASAAAARGTGSCQGRGEVAAPTADQHPHRRSRRLLQRQRAAQHSKVLLLSRAGFLSRFPPVTRPLQPR